MPPPDHTHRAVTDGTLLGGRVRYRQFGDGYRTGIEPVLLAASIAAEPGARVIEAGCGAGAALLCLAARLPGIAGLGVERDAELAGLAAGNVRDNGWQGRLDVVSAAIEQFDPAGQPQFDHAMANPPWHDRAGTRSPDPVRDAATHGGAGLLAGWIVALAGCLRPGGTVSLIVPPAMIGEGLAALDRHGCGSHRLYPLWTRHGRDARMVLLHATRGGRAALRLEPGLLLHGDDGGFTAAAEHVLRTGRSLHEATGGSG